MVGEQVLDLAREDVLAAGDDHLVVAAVDEEAALAVEVADVAAAQKAVDRLLAAAAGVALERHLAADEDPADVAARDLLAVLVEELDHGAARGPAGGPGRGPQVLGGRDRRHRDLGRAVEVVDVVPVAVHPLQRQLAGQRRARHRGDPQRGEVVGAERLLRQLQDPLDHHRDDGEDLGAVLLDRLQRPLGVETPPQDEGRAGRQADREVEEAPGVEERRRDHHRLAAAVGDLVDHRGDGVEAVGVAALGALRGPGRPRGEDHEAGMVGRRLQVGVVVGGDQGVERRLVGLAVGPGDDPVDGRVDPLEQAGELLVVDEHLRFLAAGHLDQLRAGEHRVQVERAGADLGAGGGDLDEAAVVAAHHPDPVAVPEPHPLEGVGEGVAAAVELVEGERPALVDDRRLVRVVDRGDRDAGRRRGAPAQERGADLGGDVGAHQAEDVRLVRDLRDEGFVGDRLADTRPYGAEGSHPEREDYSLSTEATAMQAIPSPRPIQPIPSLVVALTLTRAEVASARIRSISARSGPRRGSSQTTVASMFSIRPLIIPTTVRSRSIESASRQRSSSSGNRVPMSPRPPAPSRASITAWVRTSASEWPSSPRSCSTSTPPRTSGRLAPKRWLS